MNYEIQPSTLIRHPFNLISVFLYPVNRSVCFGIHPVRGKIGGDCVDLAFDAIQSCSQSGFDTVQPRPQSCFDTIYLVAQHLMPFNYDIQLVLKIVSHHANMMLENLFNFLDIACIHKTSKLIKTAIMKDEL